MKIQALMGAGQFTHSQGVLAKAVTLFKQEQFLPGQVVHLD